RVGAARGDRAPHHHTSERLVVFDMTDTPAQLIAIVDADEDTARPGQDAGHLRVGHRTRGHMGGNRLTRELYQQAAIGLARHGEILRLRLLPAFSSSRVASGITGEEDTKTRSMR